MSELRSFSKGGLVPYAAEIPVPGPEFLVPLSQLTPDLRGEVSQRLNLLTAEIILAKRESLEQWSAARDRGEAATGSPQYERAKERRRLAENSYGEWDQLSHALRGERWFR